MTAPLKTLKSAKQRFITCKREFEIFVVKEPMRTSTLALSCEIPRTGRMGLSVKTVPKGAHAWFVRVRVRGLDRARFGPYATEADGREAYHMIVDDLEYYILDMPRLVSACHD